MARCTRCNTIHKWEYATPASATPSEAEAKGIAHQRRHVYTLKEGWQTRIAARRVSFNRQSATVHVVVTRRLAVECSHISIPTQYGGFTYVRSLKPGESPEEAVRAARLDEWRRRGVCGTCGHDGVRHHAKGDLTGTRCYDCECTNYVLAPEPTP